MSTDVWAGLTTPGSGASSWAWEDRTRDSGRCAYGLIRRSLTETICRRLMSDEYQLLYLQQHQTQTEERSQTCPIYLLYYNWSRCDLRLLVLFCTFCLLKAEKKVSEWHSADDEIVQSADSSLIVVRAPLVTTAQPSSLNFILDRPRARNKWAKSIVSSISDWSFSCARRTWMIARSIPLVYFL